MIKVCNVSKTYRIHKKEPGLWGSVRSLFARRWENKLALQNVSLEVGAGEIVGLIGSNGAGKTTLVKILAGVLHADAGAVSVMGDDPWERHSAFRGRIALIMGQKAQLWWDLPAADCFLLLREIYKIPARECQETLDYLTSTLGVSELLNVQIRRLSLGERMKMELIAALLHSPSVVYLDEPTIGLDVTAQRAIRSFILDYRKKHNPAMILTSHYMDDIRHLCKRIVILRKGAIVYDGSLAHISDDYVRYKIMTVVVDMERLSLDDEELSLPSELGEVLARPEYGLKIKVPRDKVLQCSRYLFEKLPVADLTIENEEIGRIIEAIQRG
jgi:ABC-2 type transport system ATP-binding protein